MTSQKIQEDQEKAIPEEADLSAWFRTSEEEPKTGFIQGNTFDLKEVKYSAINGEAIFEGDISLGSVEDMEALAKNVQQKKEFGLGLTGNQFRWPDGLVPFEIDPTLANQQRVTDAIQHWLERTPIRFVERTVTNASQFPNYVRFVDRNACFSQVGMVGGMQEISLGTGCSTGSAIHEIGHAVGLWHEQSREDREGFVRILWANIQDQMRHNFNQHITDGDDIGAYDFGSIMHYPTHAFSKNGQPTIEPIGGQAIGQRTGLSAGDIAAVRSMYLTKLAQAMWIHGTSLQVEYPDRIARTWRAGFYTEIEGKPNTENWFHFAIPSKVIVNDRRLRIGSVMLLSETLSADAVIRDVHIYDGPNKIAQHNGVNLSGNLGFRRFDAPTAPFVQWGVGISIGVRFGSTGSRVMRFKSAGCDFVL